MDTPQHGPDQPNPYSADPTAPVPPAPEPNPYSVGRSAVGSTDPTAPVPVYPPTKQYEFGPNQPPAQPNPYAQQYDAPQPPTPLYPQYGVPYGQPGPPTGYNGLAITSMVVGILSLCGFLFGCVGIFLAITAVVLGHVAVSQVKRTGQPGRGMALAGLICGYVGIGLSIAGILFGFLLGLADLNP